MFCFSHWTISWHIKRPSINDSLITHESRQYLLLGCIGQSSRSLWDDKCYRYSLDSCDTSALKVWRRFRFTERTVLSPGSAWLKPEAEATSFWEAMTILSPKFRSHQDKTLSPALTKQRHEYEVYNVKIKDHTHRQLRGGSVVLSPTL